MTQDINNTRGLSPCAINRLVVLLLLMMVVGVNGSWAQTDYSGTYYIGSNSNSTGYKAATPANNYYICPTEGWIYYQPTNKWSTDGTTYPNPFITTYKCRSDAYHSGDASDAVWTIEKAPAPNSDYYYIKHNKDGKYWVSNGQISGTSNANRMRVHLEAVADGDLDDKVLFEITPHSDSKSIVISPKSSAGWNYATVNGVANTLCKWYTVNNGNKDYLVGNGSNGGPSGYTATGGILGLYTQDDINARFVFEDIIVPEFEQQDDNTIAISCPGCSIYYTTDGSTPDTSDPGQLYTAPVAMTGAITTVKVIAVKPAEAGETLGRYSRCITYTTERYIGSNYPFLIQSQENTNYYMIPVTDTNNAGGFIKANTTTLGQPAMMWYFKNAGTVGGVQYYYIINKSTGQYVYYHNPNSNHLISVSAENYDDSFAALDDEGKEPYRFSINAAADGGYNICPKSKADRCITKGTSNQHNGYINTQSSKTAAIGRWDFISVSDQKMPATTPPVTVSTASAAEYYTIENERNTGNYISPATYVTTTTSVTDNDKWYFLQAAKDDWLTYYHIVNAVSGKYLYLNNTGSNAVSTKALSEDTANPDKYQFVLAPSSTGAFYIIPKSQATQRTRQFTSLYSDAANPLQTKNRRFYVAKAETDPENLAGDDAFIKWIFAEADLDACQDPVFSESGGDIILSCPTFGAEIHYTIDGSTPTASTPTVYSNETSLPTSSQYLVKAMAVFKNDPSDPTKDVSSSDVILFNKPDVTLSQDTYIYDRTAHEPTVSKVAITISETEYEAPTSPTVSYVIDGYENNTNAGTATVNLVDNIDDDNIFFSNFSKDFTISKASLTITPNDGQSKEYGDPDPVLTYTSSGLVAGDELVGTLSRAGGETVGTYAISQGTLNNANNTNYDISFTTGKTFAITAKSLGDGTDPATNITCDILETSGSYSIVVKQGGSNLTLGSDYTKSSESGVSDGKYYNVTVEGTGNYDGGFTVKLAKILLSKLTGSSAPGGAALFVSNSDDANFVVPDNMTAYIVTGISGNTLVTEQLDNIPKQVPVLLVSTIDANGFLVQNKVNPTPMTGTNLLKEVTDNPSKHFDTAKIYLLYNGEFVLNMAGDLAKGKIYLPVPEDSPAPAILTIDWGATSGIEEIPLSTTNAQRPGTWYTLEGIKLNGRPAKKGLYLKDGKKTVVK